MGLGNFYYKLIKREYYKDIPIGLLLLNWIVQRVFRINSKVPYSVHYTSRVNGADNLNIIGDKAKVSIAVSGGCYFSCHKGKVTIGENTIFANNVTIVANNHGMKDRNIYVAKDVKIGENCWIGAGAVILPGVNLNDNVTVGANSVVTKDCEQNSIYIGVPAKKMKQK